jgi:hypothetical protein
VIERKPRRPAAPADLFIGAIVYKGNGPTAWRVWGVTADGSQASVVKATTATNPARGCWYSVDTFQVEA